MELSAIATRPASGLPDNGQVGALPGPAPNAQSPQPLQVRRRQINKQDEIFEALMALIDSAQGRPHDPQANKITVEEVVAGSSQVVQQRTVG